MGRVQRQLRLMQIGCFSVLVACAVLAHWQARENGSSSNGIGTVSILDSACTVVGYFGVHTATQAPAPFSIKILQIHAVHPMAGRSHFSALLGDCLWTLGSGFVLSFMARSGSLMYSSGLQFCSC